MKKFQNLTSDEKILIKNALISYLHNLIKQQKNSLKNCNDKYYLEYLENLKQDIKTTKNLIEQED